MRVDSAAQFCMGERSESKRVCRRSASQTMEDISHASWDDAEEKDKP